MFIIYVSGVDIVLTYFIDIFANDTKIGNSVYLDQDK